MNLFDLNLTLPISDPTWVFFLVLIIILFAPMILGRLHIPHICLLYTSEQTKSKECEQGIDDQQLVTNLVTCLLYTSR